MMFAAATGLLGGVAIHWYYWHFAWWHPQHRQVLVDHWNAGTISQPFLLSGFAGVIVGAIACFLIGRIWARIWALIASSIGLSRDLFRSRNRKNFRKQSGLPGRSVTCNTPSPQPEQQTAKQQAAEQQTGRPSAAGDHSTSQVNAPEEGNATAPPSGPGPGPEDPPAPAPDGEAHLAPETVLPEDAMGEDEEESESDRRERLYMERLEAEAKAAAAPKDEQGGSDQAVSDESGAPPAAEDPSATADPPAHTNAPAVSGPALPEPALPEPAAPTLHDYCQAFIRAAGYMEIPANPRDPGKIGAIAADGQSAFAFCFMPEGGSPQVVEAAAAKTRGAAARFYDGLTTEGWLDQDDPDNGLRARIFLVGPANSTRPTNTLQSIDLGFLTLPDPPPLLDDDVNLVDWQEWLAQVPESNRTIPDESLSITLTTFFANG
ncbi:MAG: hypothetical protein CMM40_12860 [Rhodospirillaceae bacterium]|nr:hypothetical protein [Rhodospirillaceae bacterium]